jgi:hypothetical protein
VRWQSRPEAARMESIHKSIHFPFIFHSFSPDLHLESG